MRLILIFISLLLLSSCVTERRCARMYPPQERVDSVYLQTVVYRDTTIFVHLPGDTIRDTIHVEVVNGLIQSQRSQLETQLALSWAQVVDGMLLHELQQKDTTIARIIEQAIREASTETVVTKEVVHKVYELTNWQWLQLWAGRIALLLLILLALARKFL